MHFKLFVLRNENEPVCMGFTTDGPVGGFARAMCERLAAEHSADEVKVSIWRYNDGTGMWPLVVASVDAQRDVHTVRSPFGVPPGEGRLEQTGGSYPVERADDLSTSGPVRRFHRKLFLGLIALPLLWATPTGAEELASYAIGPGAMFAAPSLSRVAANNQDRPAPVSEPAVASLVDHARDIAGRLGCRSRWPVQHPGSRVRRNT